MQCCLTIAWCVDFATFIKYTCLIFDWKVICLVVDCFVVNICIAFKACNICCWMNKKNIYLRPVELCSTSLSKWRGWFRLGRNQVRLFSITQITCLFLNGKIICIFYDTSNADYLPPSRKPTVFLRLFPLYLNSITSSSNKVCISCVFRCSAEIPDIRKF